MLGTFRGGATEIAMASLEMITHGEGDCRGEELVLSVDGRISGASNIAIAAANDLARQGPGPALALVSETQAAHVEIGVRNERSVVFVRRGGLAKKIAGTGKIAFTELARN